MKRSISRDDIMPLDRYGQIRSERRKALIALKKNRRIHVGPHATVHFECYETMWHQVHEMLYIEKGGEAQLAGELEAYNPLIPQGNELVATVMFEIEDEARRHRILAGLGGVERRMALTFGGERVTGVAEADIDRTTAAGKASSVQFLHFPFTAQQIGKFRTAAATILFVIDHPNYRHAAALPEPVRAALAEDFD